MSTTQRLLVILGVACLFAGAPLAVLAEDPMPSPDDETLKSRYEARKDEERAYKDAQAKAQAAHEAALEAMGIAAVVPVGDHGDPARCVDIAYIGDGFAQKDQSEWAAVVDRMTANFDTPPFDALDPQINHHRVDLVSPESGIRTADNPVNPPLSGEVKPVGKLKLLTCNAKEALRRVRAVLPEVDYVLVVLNTHGKFLGSANSTGAIVLLSTSGGHQRSIVVHEFGHLYVNLLDEYVDAKQGGERAPPAGLERGYNVTLEMNVHAAKWHHWNVPEDVFRGRTRGKPFKPEDNVRCYEGAATYLNDVYRAEENCHMQRGRGKAFCRLCCELSELGTYRFFTPLESVSPYHARLSIGRKQTVPFAVTPAALKDAAKSVQVAWYLDGKRLDAKKSKVEVPKGGGRHRHVMKLKGSDFGEGAHDLTAVLDILTPRVRMDRGWLSATYSWRVEVSAKGPQVKAPTRRITVPGTPVEFQAAAVSGSSPGTWRVANPPAGATFEPETATFRWTPADDQLGAHLLELVRDGGRPGESPGMLVIVKPVEKQRNQGPKFLFLPDQEAQEGATLTFHLLAYDPEGDQLAWTAKALPPGARLEPSTGRFRWPVGCTQRGSYVLDVEVTDGQKRERKTVNITVGSAPLYRGVLTVRRLGVTTLKAKDLRDAPDWMLVGLHHPSADVRTAGVKQLADLSRQARLAEALRLLREVNPELSGWARSELQRIFDSAEDDAHMDLFLDQMPQRVWQLVNRQEDLDAVRGWCQKALGMEGLKRARKKALEALVKDLDLIDSYNEERLAREPQPPITDKKYR